MTDLSPEVQKLLEKTRGGGVRGLENIDDVDLCALIAYYNTWTGIGKHIGKGRSWTGEYCRRRLANLGVRVPIDARTIAIGRYPELAGTDEEVPSGETKEALLNHYRNAHERMEAKLRRLSDAYAVIQEIIAVEVDSLPPVKPKFKVKSPTSVDEELCELHLSDIHVGEWVRLEETAGLSAYSWETFMERRERLIERFDSVINHHIRNTYPVKHCLVQIYGDCVTGENIFKGQSFQIDQFLLEQIVRGSYQIADLIRYIASTFETVRVLAIPGNHGRITDTTLNSDVLFYMFMRQYLAEQDNVVINISDTSPFLGYYLDADCGILDWSSGRRHNHLMAHGNQVRSYIGVPYYGLDRIVGKLNNLFGVVWDRVMFGHFHTEGRSPNWMLCPSWVGATGYSVGKLQVASRPAQLVNGFHPRQGMTWQYTLWLDEAPRIKQPEDGNIYTPHDTVFSDKVTENAGGFEE